MRRAFDHLHAELSVAAGRMLPRYALWLRLVDAGLDPERLRREQSLAFCRDHAAAFLAEQGIALSSGGARRLERAVRRFDARFPTPYERLARL
jgi:hypothetical protein